MTRVALPYALLVIATGTMVAGCQSGGVGDPCIPNDEYSPDYGSATEKGTQIEDRSFQCETRVCLIKQFRGRVSCPFGNELGGSQYHNRKGISGNEECYVPGTTTVVKAAVKPQCGERKNQVYCSCRCAGSDTAAKYCECPDGYECADVSSSLDPTLVRAGDKYCVKAEDVKQGITSSFECNANDSCDKRDDYCGYKSNTYEIE